MEIIALLAIGMVIGVPAMAIIALVRTRTAERRIEESWSKISDLEGEIAGLRRDLAKISDCGFKLETPEVRSEAGNRTVSREPEPLRVANAAGAREKVKAGPLQPSESPVSSTRLDQPAAPLRPRPEASPAPATAFGANEQPSPVEISTFETATQAQVGREEEPASAAPVPALPRPATPPASAVPGSRSIPLFTAQEPATPGESIFERLKTNLPLEQLLGMNLFAKVGIVLLVLGLALLGHIALIAIGPGPRVALSYALAALMLGGGIWLERGERYRLLGRTGIGGGWALLFFTTYALDHVAPMTVMRSNTLDCILLFIVAIAIVAHTLRYRSQLVTGLAFLLGFSTVALSQDTVYALVAGVILALGIAAIALRMSWFELEIFGILAP
jgi:hypothetical protein